jgi:hypothetical protein
MHSAIDLGCLELHIVEPFITRRVIGIVDQIIEVDCFESHMTELLMRGDDVELAAGVGWEVDARKPRGIGERRKSTAVIKQILTRSRNPFL